MNTDSTYTRATFLANFSLSLVCERTHFSKRLCMYDTKIKKNTYIQNRQSSTYYICQTFGLYIYICVCPISAKSSESGSWVLYIDVRGNWWVRAKWEMWFFCLSSKWTESLQWNPFEFGRYIHNTNDVHLKRELSGDFNLNLWIACSVYALEKMHILWCVSVWVCVCISVVYLWECVVGIFHSVSAPGKWMRDA